MKLYQMNDQQRIDYLLQNNYLDQTQADFLRQRQPLTQDISDGLSENQIGMMGLPYGFATDF
jgi:Hydroxymethylglutaryl-CoA reductase